MRTESAWGRRIVAMTSEEFETGSDISLEGMIDITCGAELKALLLKALDAAKEVRVSIQDATYMDVTAIELLCAARVQARHAGVSFGIKGPVPDAISVALADAGFEAFPVLDEVG